jgi:hypothetical protein
MKFLSGGVVQLVRNILNINKYRLEIIIRLIRIKYLLKIKIQLKRKFLQICFMIKF